MRYFYPHEYKALLRLGIPISVGQIGMMLQNLMDNIMVGRHSTQELAAAGLVNNLFIIILLLTVGYSIGAIPVIGALYSKHKTKTITQKLKNSLVTDVLQGSFVMSLLVVTYFLLPYMGQPEELMPLMKPYLFIQIISLPFVFVFNPFRQFTDSINDTSVAMVITLIGNVWNILFNWLLIYGHGGFPEMGIIGAGWATCTSRILMCFLILGVFMFRPKYKEYKSFWSDVKVKINEMKELNRLGWPIALQMGMEVGAFSLVTIFAGWFGTSHLAAHQVMLALSQIIFMTFMGISSAVSIRVSNYRGLNDLHSIRQTTMAGWEIVFVVSAMLSALVFVFRNELSLLFTDSLEVCAIVSTCVYALMLYQLGDGIQCTYLNALRGMGDVKKLMKYSFIAYVIISIPLSFLFCVPLKLGTFGIWLGFPFGLTAAGIMYMRRFLIVSDYKRQKF